MGFICITGRLRGCMFIRREVGFLSKASEKFSWSKEEIFANSSQNLS